MHFARLPDGTDVAVKVLRPGIERVIEHDLALLEVAAVLLEKLWPKAATETARGGRRVQLVPE